MIEESIECEVGDRIVVAKGLMIPAGTYRVINKNHNYVRLTRDQDTNHHMTNSMKGTSQRIDYAGNSNPDKILAGEV